MTKKILLSLAAAILVMTAAVVIGTVMIPLDAAWGIIAHHLFGTALPEGISGSQAVIIWNIRIPRVLMGFMVGAALASSGAVTQSLLRNPLASPYTLGVSAGAALGAGVIIITGFTLAALGSFLLPITGTLCGLLSILAAIVFASRVDAGLSTNTIVLAGMVFSLFINAMLTMLTVLNRESLERIAMWQLGTLSGKSYEQVFGFLPFLVVGLFGFLLFSRELDLFTFGEEQAMAAGVNTKRLKWVLLTLCGILTGSAVSFSGIIGFVDMIVPHIVRRIFGNSHRLLLPMTMIFGGMFMVLADLIARTVMAPSELPVGVICALTGAPFFIWVYFKRSGGGKPHA